MLGARPTPDSPASPTLLPPTPLLPPSCPPPPSPCPPPQDFAKIQAHLPQRSVQEVVSLYYAIQHTDEFSHTRRKYLLRKRREQVRRAGVRGLIEPDWLPASGLKVEG